MEENLSIADQGGFGPHLTLDLSGCDKAKLTSFDFLFELLDSLPSRIGMTRITTPFIRPWLDQWATIPGYSGFVILAESHISFHTFPDAEYVFIDLFSCRNFDVDVAVKFLMDSFGAKKCTKNVVRRGIDFPKE